MITQIYQLAIIKMEQIYQMEYFKKYKKINNKCKKLKKIINKQKKMEAQLLLK